MTRPDSRADKRRRRDRDPQTRTEPPKGRSFMKGPGGQALLIFSVLLAIYLMNGDILPGQDATASVRLAGKLVTKHSLVFTPQDDPFMFEWQLDTAEGKRPATFRTWDATYQGRPIREAYERGQLTAPNPFYYLIPTKWPGAYANKYGIGAGLFAAPFVAATYPFARDLYAPPSSSLLWHTTKLAAACAVAGSAVFLFLAALAFVRPGTAALLAFAYGLTTCAWSTSSQALWQHGPTDLFLAMGTFFLLRQNRARSAAWAGLAYSLAFLCRPTAALALVAAAVYYAIRDRRALLLFLAACLPVAALLSAYNLHTFGKLVVLGQLSGERLGKASAPLTPGQAFSSPMFQGLAGILVSPSRGLLMFSPAIAFLFWGFVRVWRDRNLAALRPVALAGAAMCLVVARWHGWWGGWSYGYRLLIDAVTLFAFLAIPIAEEIRRRRILTWTCAVCLLWGLIVQGVGAFAYDVDGWNNRVLGEVQVPGSEPLLFTDAGEARREAWVRGGSVRATIVDVDSPRGQRRLWSIRDNQIFYYLSHFSEARAAKQKAIEQFLRERG